MEFGRTQEQAIRHNEGPMMILAGPGSGKTTVITQRIKYLTESLNINPADILVITFTRAAAEEMKERYIRLTGNASRVTFGTFHSIFFPDSEAGIPLHCAEHCQAGTADAVYKGAGRQRRA